MKFDALAKLISDYGSPLLGAAIGGAPGSAIATLVAHAFGGDANDLDDLSNKIAGDPEAAIKLAEIQSNTKVELQKIIASSENLKLQHQVSMVEAQIDNTKDARAHSANNAYHFPEILSIVILLGFFVAIYWIVAYKQDSEDHDVLYTMMGILSSSFSAVINYWLGSPVASIIKKVTNDS